MSVYGVGSAVGPAVGPGVGSDVRPGDLAYRHTRNPYIYIYIYVCIYIHIVYMYTGLGGWLLKTDLSD